MANSFPDIAILIPSFNPDDNLTNLVAALSAYSWSQMVIVDDGSSDDTQLIFGKLRTVDNVHVIRHSNNQGKGASLKTGIKYIDDNSEILKGIITVDADGQHLVEDIKKIAKYAQDRENDVIFGVRSFGKNTPFRSKFGNKLTKYLLYIFNGISVDDTQTGLRYLPVSIFNELLALPGNRYEYELECLFTINHLGYDIKQIQIKTVYLNDNKGSYFRPLIDSAKIYMVFARFSFSSLLSFGLDIVMFAIFLSYLQSIFIATMVARTISGVFNFILNRNLVFQVQSKNNLIKELIGYIILWVILALLSALIVSFAEGNPAGIVILFKVLVDLFLFFLAFYVQKNIIFQY
ncbi:bifunctional glycosyltransferase family 2/GtrA family protein [Candidatus Woesearchaeota archaeon]|nr:bifunctional glycosyltransferase family 2/GtrA family protein [Candidatus Woesearchaeota archaeon]MBT7556987.1 bifunctional glycosyltransferase family 2/GtrA family protein [Candidatus Woesearchaeota archaeon]